MLNRLEHKQGRAFWGEKMACRRLREIRTYYDRCTQAAKNEEQSSVRLSKKKCIKKERGRRDRRVGRLSALPVTWLVGKV